MGQASAAIADRIEASEHGGGVAAENSLAAFEARWRATSAT